MKDKLLNLNPLNTDIVVLLLRLTLGILIAYHGLTKLLAFNKILPNFPDVIGIGSELSFILAVIAELGCGILVATGLLTRFMAVPIFFTMFVAFFIAHAGDPFSKKELALVYLILSVVVFIVGSGKYSIDNLMIKKDKI